MAYLLLLMGRNSPTWSSKGAHGLAGLILSLAWHSIGLDLGSIFKPEWLYWELSGPIIKKVGTGLLCIDTARHHPTYAGTYFARGKAWTWLYGPQAFDPGLYLRPNKWSRIEQLWPGPWTSLGSRVNCNVWHFDQLYSEIKYREMRILFFSHRSQITGYSKSWALICKDQHLDYICK